MELRALGTSGLRVSPLGLGTVKFGRNEGVKYPVGFDLPDDDHVRALLNLAAELGINLIDTAPAYGSSEQRLGALLPGPRERWVIATKVGESFHDGHSRFDFSAAATRASVERSLRALRTDWLDLVLVHSDGDDCRILAEEPVVDTLLELRRAGLVRAVGFSGKTVAGGLKALEHCDAVMVTYNPAYTAERPVIEAAARAGRGVLVKKGLMSGHLNAPEGDPVLHCMAHVFAMPGVSSMVVGTISAEHLRHDAQVLGRVLGSER